MYTIEDFNNVILFVWNRGIEEFTKMYEAAGFTGEAYINENFRKARDMFAVWWLNLDKFYQTKFVEYVKNYYENFSKTL